MTRGENLEHLGGKLLKEKNSQREMPLAERIALITEKMGERNKQEAALLQLLNQPGKQAERVYTNAWMELKMLQSDIDYHVHAAIADRAGIKPISWDEGKE